MLNRAKSIKGYNEEKWLEVCADKIKPGIKAKFEQNPNAWSVLKSTGNKRIAEANPHDPHYGIGLALHNPDRLDPDNWGTNIMGNVLEITRDELLLMEQE